MVTEIAPVTFQYSHTIGRSESRSGNGFFNPVAMTHDAEDRLYVLSRGTETPAFYPCKRVTVCTLDEDMVRDFGHKYHPEEAIPGAPDGGFMWPTSVALDSQGNAYVADEWMQRITFFDKDGNCQGSWGKEGSADGEFDRPSGLAFDKDDNLYMVDSRNSRIQVFTKDGKFIRKWGTYGSGDGQFDMPWGIEIDHNGDVYVADWRNDRVQKFSSEGQFLMKFGASGDGDGEFNRPTGVAVDKDGVIYVADWKNDRVQIFHPDGSFATKLHGEATLSKWGRERVELDPTIVKGREMAQNLAERERLFAGPVAVDVDDENRLYVVEIARHRVQVFQKQSAVFQGLLL